MTREEKINEIRKCILNNKYPFAMPINFYNGNCYAYALGSSFKDTNSFDYIYNLGNISHIYYPPKSLEEGKKAFELDMETLGIDYRLSSYEEKIERLKEFFENKTEDEIRDALNRAKGNFDEATNILIE